MAKLRVALVHEDCHVEAAEIMRTLIDQIVLTPVCRNSKAPCRPPCTATWPAFSAWLPKKGRSMRATLWWSAQNWLRGLATTYTEQSMAWFHHIDGRSWRRADLPCVGVDMQLMTPLYRNSVPFDTE